MHPLKPLGEPSPALLFSQWKVLGSALTWRRSAPQRPWSGSSRGSERAFCLKEWARSALVKMAVRLSFLWGLGSGQLPILAFGVRRSRTLFFHACSSVFHKPTGPIQVSLYTGKRTTGAYKVVSDRFVSKEIYPPTISSQIIAADFRPFRLK